MVEAGAKEVPEDEMVEALERAHAAIKEIVAGIDDARGAGRQDEARPPRRRKFDRSFVDEVEGKVLGPLDRRDAHQGQARELRDRRQGRRTNSSPRCPTTTPSGRPTPKTIFKEPQGKGPARRDPRTRPAARRPQVRRDPPITIEVGVLPAHARLGLFTRGETQALVTATLGTADDQQKIETVDGETWKRFMLHYNFPPFSVGEVKFLRGPGRREIGHGALAERALAADDAGRGELPLHDPHRLGHPRVERLVVDGVGLRRIAGDDGRRRAAQGAGRRRGDGPGDERGDRQVRDPHATSPAPKTTTATWTSRSPAPPTASPRCRWTSRSRGITTEIMRKALEQARQGRLHILDKMQETLAAPRTDVSPHAPRIVTIQIPVDKIRDVIGPGGKMIRSIIERTGVKIDVEDDGTRQRRVGRRSVGAEGDRHHPGADRDAGAEQDLPGQGPAHHRLRRVRRDHARPRRPAARLRDRALPRQGRPRRAEGRRHR